MVAVVAGVALAGVGCGGSSGNDDAAARRAIAQAKERVGSAAQRAIEPLARERAGGPARRAIEPEAQERAEAAGLKLSDFPSGWRVSPQAKGASRQEKKLMSECRAETDFSKLTTIGEARSQDFAQGESMEATSTVMVFENFYAAEGASVFFSVGMRPDDAAECLHEVVGQGIKEAGGDEIKLGNIEIVETPGTPPPVPGVELQAGWRVVIPFEITSGAAKGAEREARLEVLMQWGMTRSPG